MVNKKFSGIMNFCKTSVAGILQAPHILKNQLMNIKNDFNRLILKLNNMVQSNMELGLYHLHQANYNDAILRFKLIVNYLSPTNKLAQYWLGWTYLLKGNCRKAIIHLTKAQEEDQIGLLHFIKSIDTINTVPLPIHKTHRNLTITDFTKNFSNNIPQVIAVELSKTAKALPDQYTILELGSNIGLLGNEIHKRLPDHFRFIATEISTEMVKQQSNLYSEAPLYDQVIEVAIDEYLNSVTVQYEVIISLNGFAYNANLGQIFNNIFLTLKENGYFAFALKTSSVPSFSQHSLEFSYNNTEIATLLQTNGFKVLSCQELTLELNNNYTIFVCTK
ncbi:MAG: hypothetical protein AB8B66_05315 [Rickettsiaceae bacterium]